MTTRPRLGAYVLAADPTWLRSSIARYYDRLDRLVVAASSTDRGWTGRPIAAQHCLGLVRSVDDRRIVREVLGDWVNPSDPLAGDTAQRQAAIDALDDVDWVLQLDGDEVVPDIDAVLEMISEADDRGVNAVEWPMRVLYRRLRHGDFLQVLTENGSPHHEYPGPVAVRAGTRLAHCRQAEGDFLRAVVVDDQSLQIARPQQDGEHRVQLDKPENAILHNSWARPPAVVRRKIAAWGHNQGLRSQAYFYGTWLPAPVRWQRMTNFHPTAPKLWPKLGILPTELGTLVRADELG